MLSNIAAVFEKLSGRHRFDCCGIRFGGPVDFERERVVLSTHVPEWYDFDLPANMTKLLSLFP